MKKTLLCLFAALALSACGTSSGNAASGHSLNSKDSNIRTWSLLIRQFITDDGSNLVKLWGEYALPQYVMDKVPAASLCFGDIIKLEFSCSGVFTRESVPPQLDLRDYEFKDIDHVKGEIEEVLVLNGELDLANTNIVLADPLSYQQDNASFRFAVDEGGNPVPLSRLEKAYACVSVGESRVLQGILTYLPS